MGSLHTISAPPPALYVSGDLSPVANAYFAVTVDAAADLTEAAGYRGLPRSAQLSKAQAEQQRFLNQFLDPALGAALDLRVAADPAADPRVSVALLGRVWGASADAAAARAHELRGQVHAAMPRHVIASPVDDAAAVARLLAPFPRSGLDSAVITRHELTGLPSRPDAGVSYYYSAGPFNWSGTDWTEVYGALAASPVPAVLSVAVLPMLVTAQFAQTLLTLATFYGRLAREGETHGGPYQGSQRLAPDAFAVDAEKAFHDFCRRLAHKAYALRIQVSAAGQLPPGLVETIAGAISPAGRSGGLPGHQRAVSACDVRHPASAAERRLAEYNLNVINFGMLTGRPEIWDRQDPPDPQLAMLSVLGDARDAGCAFRFPVAADGVVPGFRVRRDGPAQAQAVQADGFAVGGPAAEMPTAEMPAAEMPAAEGPAIRLGKISGTGREIAVPLRSLTRHALIAGSAGSGKTSTALEILRQLWTEQGIPFLVIEPANSGTGDYRKLADEPGFESLEFVTAGDEDGRPLRFNPFEVPAGERVGEHAANLLACFTTAFGLGGPLPSIYQDALNLTYLRAGFLSAERAAGTGRAWPTVADFLAAMDEVTTGLGYAGDVKAGIDAAATRRARRLVSGSAGSVFLTDRPGGIGGLLGHPVIIELKPLGAGDEQALVMALLLNAVTEHCQTVRGVSPGLVHVTLVEEAHRLLARAGDGGSAADARSTEKAAAAFADRLAENRRYGEGVILTERLPGRMAADAVKDINLKIMHRITAEDDRRYLGEIMGMDAAQRLLAARLRPGEALLRGDELAGTAHVSITATPRAAAPPGGVVRPSAAPPSAAPPFSACDHCRAQCEYRGAALSMVSDPGIVEDITEAAYEVTRPGSTPAERRSGLADLRGRLHETTDRFAALPAADPGRGDAAYCLFLHVYAGGGLRVRPDWPATAAGALGITAREADGDIAGDADDVRNPGRAGETPPAQTPPQDGQAG